MTSPLDPPDGNWWSEPVNRRETLWIGIASLWGLAIFGWMAGYTRFGDQNPVGESFTIDDEEFDARFADYKDDAGVVEIDGEEALVPPDDSVFIVGERFRWDGLPVALETDRSYDLHLTANIVQHGFSVRPEQSLSQQINLQLYPDKEWVVPMTFHDADTYQVICNEFCGVGHNGMHGKFFVVEEL